MSNYKSYKSLIAFMGLDPSTNQSGKHVGPSKISKRGNGHLRRVIHIMTMCSVKSDNIFRHILSQKKGRRIASGEGINCNLSQANKSNILYAAEQIFARTVSSRWLENLLLIALSPATITYQKNRLSPISTLSNNNSRN